ncbi:MYND finger containing protein, putative [Angomonas deanei]|uniref:MYND finger containing protein, putative n=1 Tax=Angomonas deanei TaxID=59799 RepID=A0A7G2C969_9TRYP|nr:MYND finger containing protein, putative [Angomonas deanei]
MEEEVALEVNCVGWLQYWFSCGRSWDTPAAARDGSPVVMVASEEGQEAAEEVEAASMEAPITTHRDSYSSPNTSRRTSGTSSRRSSRGSRLSTASTGSRHHSQTVANHKILGRIRKLRQRSSSEQVDDYEDEGGYGDNYEVTELWRRGLAPGDDGAPAPAEGHDTASQRENHLPPTAAEVDKARRRQDTRRWQEQHSAHSVFPVKLKRCVCNEVYYCCRGCQEEDWPTHKYVCRALQATAAENTAYNKDGQRQPYTVGLTRKEMNVNPTVLQQHATAMANSLFDRIVQEQRTAAESALAAEKASAAEAVVGGGRRASGASNKQGRKRYSTSHPPTVTVGRDVGTQTVPTLKKDLINENNNNNTNTKTNISPNGLPADGLTPPTSHLNPTADVFPGNLSRFSNPGTMLFNETLKSTKQSFGGYSKYDDYDDGSDNDYDNYFESVSNVNSNNNNNTLHAHNPLEEEDSFYREQNKKSMQRIQGIGAGATHLASESGNGELSRKRSNLVRRSGNSKANLKSNSSNSNLNNKNTLKKKQSKHIGRSFHLSSRHNSTDSLHHDGSAE